MRSHNASLKILRHSTSRHLHDMTHLHDMALRTKSVMTSISLELLPYKIQLLVQKLLSEQIAGPSDEMARGQHEQATTVL